MLKDSNNCVHDFAEHPYCDINLNPIEAIDGEIYGADEFRMFAYKIRRCTRTRTTTGRTARTRTVGRRLSVGTHAGYLTVPSLAPRFETEGATKAILASSLTACSSTGFTPPGTAHVHAMPGGFVNVRGRMHGGVCHHHHHQNHQNHFTAGSTCSSGSGSGSSTTTKDHQFATSSAMTMMNMPEYMMSSVTSPISTVNSSANNSDDQINCFDGVSEFLKSIKAMKIRDDINKAKSGVVGFEVSDSDLPNIEWISDLVQ
ncbi:hypothetical protein CISIN_1g048573mg [Citrus sinensis]|uniref:Uncharacterized protein n=1 Tax=Citrus sinensis TaxID=2711 RepID=A0A067DNJ9_CITSI|nr:hypothetical protein CISIN_1g048573mg [Citrus sinensis]